MTTRSDQPATNAEIVRLLNEVKAELANAKKREQELAKNLSRLLERE